MNLLDKLNNVVINQKGYHVPENTLEIDGKIIEGIRNVKVEYGVNFGLPVITMEFYANVKCKIKTAQGVYEMEISETTEKK